MRQFQRLLRRSIVCVGLGMALWSIAPVAAEEQPENRSPDIDCKIGTQASPVPAFATLDDMPPEIGAYLTGALVRFWEHLVPDERSFMERAATVDRSPRELLIAPRNGAWQFSDALTVNADKLPILPLWRFIQGGGEGDRWYAWFEGFGYTRAHHVIVLDLADGGTPATCIAHRMLMRAELCAATRSMLYSDGQRGCDLDARE